jgi:ferritin-like protein
LSSTDGVLKEKMIEELGVEKIGSETVFTKYSNFLTNIWLEMNLMRHMKHMFVLTLTEERNEFEKKYQRISKLQMPLPDHVLAFRLLDKAN